MERGTVARAALHRLDWRYLLPGPPHGEDRFKHLVLIGGSAEMKDLANQTGLAEQVSDTLPASVSADMLVLLSGAVVDLKESLRCLKPGGVLYCEVDRLASPLKTGTLTQVRRLLRQAGLTVAGTYWAKPNFAQCEMYLPLDANFAVNWYLDTLYTPNTLLRWLLELGIRFLQRLSSRSFALIAPNYAVTAVADRDASGAPAVLAHLESFRGQNLRPLLLADNGGRVVILPFSTNSHRPQAVLKVTKLRRFNEQTVNEQLALRQVRSKLDDKMRETVPRPLQLVEWGESAIAVESYVSGTSLLRRIGAWGRSLSLKRDDQLMAARWLTEFHRQTEQGRPQWSPTEQARWLESPISRYTQAFGATQQEAALFAALREYAETLVGTPFPLVWQHRDFNIWNIYRNGGQISVVDWEGARIGPALTDLLHFLTYSTITTRYSRQEAGELRAITDLFLAGTVSDAVTRAAHEAIDDYLNRMGMDRRLTPLLVVYTWIELAVRTFEDLQVFDEAGTDTRSMNRFIKYIDILAKNRNQLFADYLQGIR